MGTKPTNDDPTASQRKQDHLDLALRSQVSTVQLDPRFHYEPLFAAHPQRGSLPPVPFLGKVLRAPVWVSSMTGGTQWAGHINQNLARACRDFGLGMGLGSCRGLLNSNDHLADFQVRGIMGDDLPLYANLGIAQVEQLVSSNALGRISELLDKLEANGLIVHINPMQEWLQPEGDTIARPPIETLNALLEKMDIKLIVKEVGQGMGPKSLRALFQMPLAAIDFAASGGTNFAKLEMLRSNEDRTTAFEQLSLVGHSPVQMVEFANQIFLELGAKALCRQVIISGGIQNFLDGYYLTNKLHIPCVYGQASAFLRHARGPYDALYRFVDDQIKGLELTHNYLDII